MRWNTDTELVGLLAAVVLALGGCRTPSGARGARPEAVGRWRSLREMASLIRLKGRRPGFGPFQLGQAYPSLGDLGGGWSCRAYGGLRLCTAPTAQAFVEPDGNRLAMVIPLPRSSTRGSSGACSAFRTLASLLVRRFGPAAVRTGAKKGQNTRHPSCGQCVSWSHNGIRLEVRVRGDAEMPTRLHLRTAIGLADVKLPWWPCRE